MAEMDSITKIINAVTSRWVDGMHGQRGYLIDVESCRNEIAKVLAPASDREIAILRELLGPDIREHHFGRGDCSCSAHDALDSLAARLAIAQERERELEEEIERLQELLGPEHHVFETNPSGWAIQHPPACRPDMLACPISQASMEFDEPPVPDGRWRVEIDGHGDLQFAALTVRSKKEGNSG